MTPWQCLCAAARFNAAVCRGRESLAAARCRAAAVRAAARAAARAFEARGAAVPPETVAQRVKTALAAGDAEDELERAVAAWVAGMPALLVAWPKPVSARGFGFDEVLAELVARFGPPLASDLTLDDRRATWTRNVPGDGFPLARRTFALVAKDGRVRVYGSARATVGGPWVGEACVDALLDVADVTARRVRYAADHETPPAHAPDDPREPPSPDHLAMRIDAPGVADDLVRGPGEEGLLLAATPALVAEALELMLRVPRALPLEAGRTDNAPGLAGDGGEAAGQFELADALGVVTEELEKRWAVARGDVSCGFETDGEGAWTFVVRRKGKAPIGGLRPVQGEFTERGGSPEETVRTMFTSLRIGGGPEGWRAR